MQTFLNKIILLFLLLSAISLKAQNPSDASQDDSKTIEIISTDKLEVSVDEKEETRRLIGNVKLKQDDAIMRCDSAYYFKNKNNIKAYRNVHITQGDSVNIKADYLFYNGNTKMATFYKNVKLTDKKSEITADSLLYNLNTRKAILQGDVYLTDKKQDVYADSVEYFVRTKQAHLYDNVRLTDGEMEITSQQMDYNAKTQEGAYSGGGKLVNKETILTSETAVYHGKSSSMTFYDNVDLTTPDYRLKTQQLDYNIDTEKADFNGPTTIINEGSTIQANSGTYNAQNDELALSDRISMTSEKRTLTANDFEYNSEQGYGKAQGDVVLIDTARNLTIRSQNANFYEENDKVEAYNDALMINVTDNDSLYLTADTLTTLSLPDTTTLATNDSIKAFYAYRNVKILKKGMQGVCDSLLYSFTDSSFQMYGNPVLWTDEYQLNADTIFIHTENNNPTLIELRRNAFMANKLQDGIYNQINGKYITAYFKDNGDVDYLLVDGNAESIYYAQEEEEGKGKQKDKAFVGVNRAQSSVMRVFFAADNVDKISFIENPTATFFPMQEVNPKDFIIRGFKWLESLRPKTLEDLL